jgi:dUTP pyrophosphatase
MTYKIFVKNNLKLQEKTYASDIGIDVKSMSDPKIVGVKAKDDYWLSIDYIEYETSLYLDCLQRNSEDQMYIDVRPRSSISNKNLLLANSVGLIDPEYRDQIFVRFKYVIQPEDLVFSDVYQKIITRINYDKIYKNGDKICQLIFQKTQNVNFVYVPSLAESSRSVGKFGHTGN